MFNLYCAHLLQSDADRRIACLYGSNQQRCLCTWQVPIRLSMHVGEWSRVITVWATGYFSDVVVDINRIFLPYHVIQ